MLEKWTGEVVGQMHIYKISAQALADELGVTNRWVSAVLNGHRKPKNAEQRFKAAVNNLTKGEAMNNLQSLQILDERTVLNKDFRVYGTPDEPLFLAKDVADWIEYEGRAGQMLSSVDGDEKLMHKIYASGQNREMWFLTEDGLYEVLMQSRKPIAKAFKKEVKKILKTIRTHGMYATDQLLDNPEFAIQVFTQLKEERARRKELETENEVQRQALCDAQPKLEYYDTILSSTGTLTTSQIAADYDISAKQLNKILHEAHLQYNVNGQWILYREHMGLGYTRSKTISIVRSDGRPDTKLSTQWTQKGRLKIHEILTARGIKACMDRSESEM